MTKESIQSLLDELDNTPQGAIDDEAENKILKRLAMCWHELEGADETAMNVTKLHRAEDLSWNPPVLSFTIERHGAFVLGSSRAELHRWSIDLHQGTARCKPVGYRQVVPAAPKLDVKPIVARVCAAVQQGPASDCDLVRMHILVWKNDDELSIKHGKLIPANGYSQTIQGRRKRFREELTARMQTIGWTWVCVKQSMTFRRKRA